MRQSKKDRGTFFVCDALYVGGGEVHIKFNSKESVYVLFEKTAREDGWPISSAGIVVLKKGRQQALQECTNDAPIGERAYRILIRERFIRLDESMK